jgi:hypothetical protein
VVILALDELVLDGNSLVGNESEETDVDGATNGLVSVFSHLHGGVVVENNGLLEGCLELDVGLEGGGGKDLILSVDAADFHVSSGKGGGLSGENVNDLAGSLEGIQVLDEEVVILQLVDREGHGHRDNERHTFGDADGEEGAYSSSKVDGALD